MLDGGDQAKWQERLETELPNIRSALAWSSEQDIDLALRLGASLEQFWIVRGNLAEARRALDRILERMRANPCYEAGPCSRQPDTVCPGRSSSIPARRIGARSVPMCRRSSA